MAVTTAALSGTITDLVGDIPTSRMRSVVLAIEANTDGSMLLDTSGDRIMAGAERVTIDVTTGAYTITLVRTDSTDILPSGARLYRTYLQYPSGIPGAGNVKKYSGWWELEANGSLSDADKWPGLEVTAVSAALVASIGDMAAQVAEDAATAAAALAEVEVLVETTDGYMSAVDANVSSNFRTQQDARHDARYVKSDTVRQIEAVATLPALIDQDPETLYLTAGALSGGVLARTEHNPSTASVVTRTGATTYADVDATNAKITFNAPASGAVDVIARVMVFVDSAGNHAMLNLRSGGSDIAGTEVLAARVTSSGSSPRDYRFRVTGLTPGNSYTYTLGMGVAVAARTCTVSWGGSGTGTLGSLLMRVMAI